MVRAVMACVLTLACWAVPGSAQRSAAGAGTAGVPDAARASLRDVRDLRDVFATGWLLQDRNADDVVDFVHARIVLPAAAQEADVASAATSPRVSDTRRRRRTWASRCATVRCADRSRRLRS